MCLNPPCLVSKKANLFFFLQGDKKQKSKIAHNVICHQIGRFSGLGLKVPRASAEPIGKELDFHLLHFF